MIRRGLALVAAFVLAGGLVACNSKDDPGISPGSDTPQTTSDTLPPCDSQTTTLCLDPDGNVVRG